MSRIRTIKPEFWTSEQVMACSLTARLLFIGLWNFCDDHGVHPASLKRLKAEIFPCDDFTEEEIGHLMGELINNRLVREYEVDSQRYWIVTGWKKHQKIDKPTYRHPLPESSLAKVEDGSSNVLRVVADNSASIQRGLDEVSTADRNGMESNGVDKKPCEVETSLPANSCSNDAGEVFSHWQAVMTHPRAKLDKKRLRAIEGALKLGFTVDELKQAIDGCALTPHNMGKNDQGQRYDDISLIFRDAAHIERFMDNHKTPPVTFNNDSSNDIMAGVL